MNILKSLLDARRQLILFFDYFAFIVLLMEGLKPKHYESFRRSIVQTYGYAHILTLQRLKQGMLLYPIDSSKPKNAYPQLIKHLQLVCDYDSEAITDISYVYHGYAPISVRLIQAACRGSGKSGDGIVGPPSWKGCEDVLKLIPGPSFEETISANDRSFRKKTTQTTPLTLVVFLGGCTMAEVAALRFMSERDPSQRGFVILTTGIITGSRLLDSLLSKPGKSTGTAIGPTTTTPSSMKNITD
ncbi:hypothetical protein BASA83_012906 [Batrachochytrium salamandrivorans]|nr:hypothetical protein BASA83_012906 [Batrachochytrium salamandrivorans]